MIATYLYSEGSVPVLRSVVPLHLHAVLSHPQVVVHPLQVPLKVFVRGILTPVYPGTTQNQSSDVSNV